MSFFDDTDELTLHLNEDLTGANGDLAEGAVFDRLVESIRNATNIHKDDAIPIDNVACLLLAMHRHMQSDHLYLLSMCNGWELPSELNNRSDLRRAIGLKVSQIAERRMVGAAT